VPVLPRPALQWINSLSGCYSWTGRMTLSSTLVLWYIWSIKYSANYSTRPMNVSKESPDGIYISGQDLKWMCSTFCKSSPVSVLLIFSYLMVTWSELWNWLGSSLNIVILPKFKVDSPSSISDGKYWGSSYFLFIDVSFWYEIYWLFPKFSQSVNILPTLFWLIKCQKVCVLLSLGP